MLYVAFDIMYHNIYCFSDVALALRETLRSHGRDERDRSESKGTRWNGNGIRNGLSVDATAYESHVSIRYTFS